MWQRSFIASASPFEAFMIKVTTGGGLLSDNSISSLPADNDTGLLSFWYGNDAPTSAFNEEVELGNILFFNPNRIAGTPLFTMGNDGANSRIWERNSFEDYSPGEHHILVSWKISTGEISVMEDGVVASFPLDSTLGSPTTTGWAGMSSIRLFFNAFSITADRPHLGELYVDATSPYVSDLSTVLAKFFNSGKAVDLGEDGSTPSGSQPAVYLSCRQDTDETEFYTNKGSIEATLVLSVGGVIAVGSKIS